MLKATIRCGLPSQRFTGQAFLRTVDAVQGNAFSMVGIQDSGGLAVEDGVDGIGKVDKRDIGNKNEGETCQE